MYHRIPAITTWRQVSCVFFQIPHKMRSAPGVWYTGGYYEKIYQYV